MKNKSDKSPQIDKIDPLLADFCRFCPTTLVASVASVAPRVAPKLIVCDEADRGGIRRVEDVALDDAATATTPDADARDARR